jgi:hypothetical protein
MARGSEQALSANGLRQELGQRNLRCAEFAEHEVTFGRVPSVLYTYGEGGGHGNFIGPSFRRICANEAWRSRLGKSYTGSARVPRAGDRWRGELECANSSDALLMNVFCYPGVLRRPEVCALLGIDRGLRPEFGVRAGLAMHRGEVDRTELDLRLGSLLVEAKLTESGFGTASRDRLLRYSDVDEVFDVEELPWNGTAVRGYQLIRGVLAARAAGGRFLLLCDARRPDLQEPWFRVLRAVRNCDLRSSMALLSWQELASALPLRLRSFLAEKYGICAAQ